MNTRTIGESRRRVFLDPDGTGGSTVGLIVAAPTGVEYGTQCGGALCDERYLEGYFVPLSGVLFEPDAGRISVERLRRPFHASGACLHATGSVDPSEFAGLLRSAVNELPFWHVDAEGRSQRSRLEVDSARISDAVEGWVPVETPVGSAVLVWPNCD